MKFTKNNLLKILEEQGLSFANDTFSLDDIMDIDFPDEMPTGKTQYMPFGKNFILANMNEQTEKDIFAEFINTLSDYKNYIVTTSICTIEKAQTFAGQPREDLMIVCFEDKYICNKIYGMKQ